MPFISQSSRLIIGPFFYLSTNSCIFIDKPEPGYQVFSSLHHLFGIIGIFLTASLLLDFLRLAAVEKGSSVFPIIFTEFYFFIVLALIHFAVLEFESDQAYFIPFLLKELLHFLVHGSSSYMSSQSE